MNYKKGFEGSGLLFFLAITWTHITKRCTAKAGRSGNSLKTPNQDGGFEEWSYPYTPVLWGNTPEKFGKYLEDIAKFAKETLKEPMVVVNAWNEWTEDSYLEPDTVNGYKYLEEIKRVKEL